MTKPASKKITVWLYGLPCSGKSTLACALERTLVEGGDKTCLLDGDVLRTGLNSDLGYSDEDRAENLRRAAHVANMVANLGVIVIAAFVTPTERHRDIVRTILQNDLLMVHVDCPIEICMQRDVKGMYAKAKAGQMEGMTGLQQPFETSRSDVLTIHTDHVTIDQGVSTILKAMNQQKDW